MKALAVLSSDAISSTAYATEEILLILVLAGSVAYRYLIPIGVAIVLLLAIVIFSYRQTIHAYPNGGGSYTVSKENLGTVPSLVAASSLLVDYTLTVAVSISAGVAAITSAISTLLPYSVVVALAAIAVITVINLRGIRESGSIFAIPTYLFVGGMAVVLLLGIMAALHLGISPHPVRYSAPAVAQGLTIFLVLRAFASGCTAMTGVEAISNGVPAFKPPESNNAARTLTAMGLILGSIFLGITFLTHFFHLIPNPNETILSQLTRTIVGRTPFYYYVQVTTAAILVLAANTSFSDFPRLSSILAHDDFMPHQFAFRGDRLAFTTGIIVLAVAAGALVVIFSASVTALIPLYAIGVFTAFTLSQTGMTSRWWRSRHGRHRTTGLLINGTGAIATGIVTVIIVVTKFRGGAWMVLVLIPLIIWLLYQIHGHYSRARTELEISTDEARRTIVTQGRGLPAIVPVSQLDRAALQAITYAGELWPDVAVVHVSDDPDEAEEFQASWDRTGLTFPLTILESPYRELVGPLVNFIEQQREAQPNGTMTVVLPESVPAHLYEVPLHNQTSWRLRTALRSHPGIVIVSIPYHLHSTP